MDIEPMLMSMPEGSILTVIYDLIEEARTKLRIGQREDEIERWKLYNDGSRMHSGHTMHYRGKTQQASLYEYVGGK